MKTLFLADFSKTLTNSSNPTTWSVFAKSWLLGNEYVADRNNFYDEFHKYELEWNTTKTKEWWRKHLFLFQKYELSQKLIQEVVSKNEYFKPRAWLKEFIDFIQKNNLDLFIISSWVGNFIEEFLEYHNLNSSNIKIFWNNLKFDENWKVCWYEDSTIITPLNKWEHNLDPTWFDRIVLLWDDNSDLQMYNWKCLKIWFNENMNWYDINLWKDWDLRDLINVYDGNYVL